MLICHKTDPCNALFKLQETEYVDDDALDVQKSDYLIGLVSNNLCSFSGGLMII